jgi:CheY-like chemotaxis protein
VEDHVDTAEVLSRLLEMAGYDVRAVHDGSTALSVARAFRPHVVLTDIGLPIMNGHELARRIRNEPETADAYLVAFTSRRKSEVLSPPDTVRAEFDEYLEKPVNPDRIEEVLRHLLANVPAPVPKTSAAPG